MRISTSRIAPAVALTGGVLFAGACGGASRYDALDAPELYRLAQQEVAEEDLGDASEALDRLMLRFPEFDSIQPAMLLLGDVYYEDDKYVTAAAQFSRFVSRYPASPEVPRASFRICQSYAEMSRNPQRDQTETNQALSVCRGVARDFFGTQFADSAATLAGQMIEKLAEREYDIARFYYQRRGFDASVKYFEKVVEAYPETEFAPLALVGIMDAYTEIAKNSPDLGYEQEVELARERLITQYPLSEAAARVRAELAGQMGGVATDTLSAAGIGAAGSRTVPSG